MLPRKILLATMMAASLGVSAKEVIVNGTFSDASAKFQTGWDVGTLLNNYMFLNGSYTQIDAGNISQSFTGLSGQLSLTFTYSSMGSDSAWENVYWNDTLIGKISGQVGGVYSYTFMATGNDKLTFAGYNNQLANSISAVSLKDAAPVPEPSTYAMLLAGLATTVALARRRS
ncbi:PEP-CTERM sorting domain-containing protein [Oxalobacteraceae bacterium A2-2]